MLVAILLVHRAAIVGPNRQDGQDSFDMITQLAGLTARRTDPIAVAGRQSIQVSSSAIAAPVIVTPKLNRAHDRVGNNVERAGTGLRHGKPRWCGGRV